MNAYAGHGLGLLALVHLSACTTASSPGTDGGARDAGQLDAGEPVAEAADDAVVDYDKLIELCSARPTDDITYDDEAELVELLVGKWLLCHYTHTPARHGVWFRADRTWAELFFRADASVRVATGEGETGEWSIDRDSNVSLGPTEIAQPAFKRGPIQLREVDGTEQPNVYVRLRDVLKHDISATPDAGGCEEPYELPLMVQDAPLADLDESDQGSGIVRCADGSIHRQREARCPVLTLEFDPTGGFNPSGIPVDLPDGGVAKRSECETDDDCDAGHVCRCATSIVRWTQCVPSNCASAADCDGRECGGQHFPCGELGAFACRTEEDECRVGETCPPGWSRDGQQWLVGAGAQFCGGGTQRWRCSYWDGDCE
jgi:hypothetical protein